MNNLQFIKCIQETCAQGPLVTDFECGEIMCGSCGIVLVDKIVDREHSEHIFSNEDFAIKNNFGPKLKLSFHDGLSTMINSRNIDSTGRQLSHQIRTEFYRLRKWDRNSKLKNRSFQEPFVLLDAMRTKLSLSDTVIENSAYIYRKAASYGIIKGRKKSGIMCAAIYAACRTSNTPRTLIDIAKVSNISKKLLQKSYRELIKNLDLKSKVFTPMDFITRIASSVNAHEKTRLDAICLIKKAQKMGIIVGRNPIGIASAALYLACVNNNEDISQKKIAIEAGTTSVTIRNGCQHLRKKLELSKI